MRLDPPSDLEGRLAAGAERSPVAWRLWREWCFARVVFVHVRVRLLILLVVLVGLGKLGYRTYRLLRDLGETVVVIERDPDNQFLDVVRRDGSPLFLGDARREALLEDAHIRQAKSIVLATDDDLANLETALDARRVAPGIRVVLRMFDQNMADKIGDGFNIHIAMSQSAMSAPAFATAAIDASVIKGFIVSDQLIVMQRWVLREGGPLSGKTVGELMSEYGFGVVEHRPQSGQVRFFPPPSAPLRAGDQVVIQGLFKPLAGLREQAAEVTVLRPAAVSASESPP